MSKLIRSLGEFNSKIGKIKREPNFEYFYRGHSTSGYSLMPSIYRSEVIEYEDKIFKEIMVKTPNEFIHEKTTLEKLVKMQHFGAMTRLLDITSNPLVALYFACLKGIYRSGRGEVFVFKIPINQIKYYDSDTVTILANLSRRPVTFKVCASKKMTIKQFNESEDIPFLLHDIRDEKPQFLSIIDPSDLRKAVPVKVKHNNSRISKQEGAFFLFGMQDEKRYPAQIQMDWIINRSLSDFSLQIGERQKVKILNELSQIGINESALFPEIEYQARHISKKYNDLANGW